ncbi:MAG: helix-turn-helix transcriptional regulator [Candidatus Dormibacter sp.]
MERGWALDAARQDLARMGASGFDSKALRTDFLHRLNRVIAFDAAWFAMCDPATLLFTDAVRQEMSQESTPLFVEDEFLLDDYNKWVDLARVPVHARSLAQATDGRLLSSYRYREILEPLGLGDELRAALVADHVCWGFICLHRELHSPEFNLMDASWLDSLAPTMAIGLRASLLWQTSTTGSDEVGVIVLASDLSVVAMSAAAEGWLAEVSDSDWPGLRELPSVVLGVAAQLRAEESGRGPVESGGARLRTRGGVWLTVRGSRLAGAGVDGQMAVVLAPAAPMEMAAMIMQAYDLTEREREVTGLVLKGTSTKAVGAALRISGETVQQHLKSIFDKTGVRSRRELAAQIFAGQYQPRLRNGSPIGREGWFSD